MVREQPLAGTPPVSMTAIPSLAAERRAWLSRHLQRQVIPRIVLILVCALFLLPFYWMVNTALKTTSDLVAYPPLLWPTDLAWSNFREAVEYIPFWQYLRNTSVITALTIIGSVISNPIIAYGFSRVEWPGRDQIFYLVLATVFIPFPVLIVALFDIFAKTPRPVLDGWQLAWEGNWINTYLPLVVPMFFGNAFWIFLMRQRVSHFLPDCPAPGAARHRCHQHLRWTSRLERFSRSADIPSGREQVHPLHRTDLLPITARNSVQPPHGGGDSRRPAGRCPLPLLPTCFRGGHQSRQH
jgi:hypothetical protein